MSAEPVGFLDPRALALVELMNVARQGPLTIADLEQVDPTVGRLELIDGTLLVTPNPDADHLRISRRLANTLDTLVPMGCEAFEGLNIFEPGSDRMCLIPDVVVVETAKLVRIPGQGQGVFPDAMELVIEITSSNRDVDLGLKRERYETWGVPYLVIDRQSLPYEYRIFGQWPAWAQEILG